MLYILIMFYNII